MLNGSATPEVEELNGFALPRDGATIAFPAYPGLH
jgi:hypothetical protein